MNKITMTSATLWFTGGLALGSLAAVLLTTQTGKDARRRLRDTASESRESLLATGGDILAKSRELFERGREIAEEAAEALERSVSIAEKKIEERF